MYENFFHFKEKPFSLTPDPRFMFLSKQHQGALDHMLYGINQREGFMVIVGDVGTGKTTLCRCLLDRLPENIQVALILNPMLSDMDLLRTCVHDLGVRPAKAYQGDAVLAGASDPGPEEEAPAEDTQEPPDAEWVNRASKKELIDALNAFLLAQHESGGSTVLIIDEAQNLSLDVMEQLRILSNLETEKEKLLQIIFVGQLELNEKLKLPALKQLNQRISIRYEITPLHKEETVQYISHRILVAGAGSRVSFTRSALNEIYSYSRGYPRLTNLVCDRSLLGGYNAQVDTIERTHVRQAIKSLLGEEDKDYFRDWFLKARLPVLASFLFFIAGLVFFSLPYLKGRDNSPSGNVLSLLGGVVAPPDKGVMPGPRQRSVPPAARKNPDKNFKPTRAPAAPPPIPPAAVPSPGRASAETLQEENGPLASPDEEPVQPSRGKAAVKYRIQIYSLKNEARAKAEVQKLEEEGFDAFWKKAESMGKDWFIVYVGPFPDIEQARIYLDALKYSGRNPILLSVSKSG